MMFPVLALLVWFALSIPATLILGRILAATGRRWEPSEPERRPATIGHALTSR